jgi:hypothetical protein
MIGEVHEAAAWFHIGAMDRVCIDVQSAFDADRSEGYEFGLIAWEVLAPGEGVAPACDNAAPTLRLLVGRAKVTAEPARGTFLAELDRVDLNRLRKLTREAHRAQFGGKVRPMRNAEVDDVIEEFGPKAAEGALRELVARGQ